MQLRLVAIPKKLFSIPTWRLFSFFYILQIVGVNVENECKDVEKKSSYNQLVSNRGSGCVMRLRVTWLLIITEAEKWQDLWATINIYFIYFTVRNIPAAIATIATIASCHNFIICCRRHND